ncbi:TPA: hypothetical protein DIC20_01285 [Candidatus Dependentiae bacterium]|nr:MAG: hypothetical protein US03_C0002G0135 [candidate division TM6 bacterium GW2011_GWF2_36_131]KKQ03568.1 MAG: hypothetical protein US13_C0002G0134 [candidate division TM6 bacterium GW2011_GWE2_36_25]KKQ20156.1 MAG: hypothetical protein US32_C0001G0053 [candidate division TM6 bacterium GW2011_GWA2_36_9]HBR70698.1 hypothetical protein [Candidatus Dependentiae bacterium]HCU00318.1 hypothetical protein [Candidatus Dependentiae bacterium]
MKSGFTLIELIVALAITAGISILLFQVYNQSMRLLTRVDSVVSTGMKINSFYDRLEKDFSGAFIPLIGDLELAKRVLEKHEGLVRTQQVRQQEQGKDGAQKTAKVQSQKVKPVTLGDIQVKRSFVCKQKNERLSQVSFITCNPLEVYKQIKPRIARVTYSLESDPLQKGQYKLIRKESKKLNLGAIKEERGFVLLNHIKSFRLELLATEPPEEKEEKKATQKKEEKSADKKTSEVKKEQKEEIKEEKPRPLKSYTEWPPEEKEKSEKKKLPRDLPEFVKVFLTYADPFVSIDKKYEFVIPIFNYRAPTKEVLDVPLLVQERLKKEEEESGPVKTQKKETKVEGQKGQPAPTAEQKK